jgi:hypothetical protein
MEGSSMQSYRSHSDELWERISEVEVDAGIPVKLLFLINAMPLEKILTQPDKVGYISGGTREVGMKLQ